MDDYAFGFFEVVTRVDAGQAEIRELVVLGRSADDGVRYYSCAPIRGDELVGDATMLVETELRSTGRALNRSDIYDGQSLRVGEDGWPRSG